MSADHGARPARQATRGTDALQEPAYDGEARSASDFEGTIGEIAARRADLTAEAFSHIAAGAASAGPRAWRIGTLSKFAEYMVREGVIGGPLDSPTVQHRLQKCAYIAQRMGAGLDYEFGFLESGAFSTGLAVDIYRRGAASGGAEPFGGDGGRAGAFLRLVRGRSDSWLRVATFALCPRGVPAGREEFVDYVTWHDAGLDRGLVAGVFDEVRALAASGGRGPAA